MRGDWSSSMTSYRRLRGGRSTDTAAAGPSSRATIRLSRSRPMMASVPIARIRTMVRRPGSSAAAAYTGIRRAAPMTPATSTRPTTGSSSCRTMATGTTVQSAPLSTSPRSNTVALDSGGATPSGSTGAAGSRVVLFERARQRLAHDGGQGAPAARGLRLGFADQLGGHPAEIQGGHARRHPALLTYVVCVVNVADFTGPHFLMA